MLQLNRIFKDYNMGDTSVHALSNVSINFRKNEFVSILGPSGCGKTTMLNIIGGLDRYTDGDIVINGISTKKYKDSDWDSYRNHSIGFVFQNYNLIPHQTVLANVELALTLSGVSKSERRARAISALEKVGLGNQIRKKPNQMSGGQMQRVAIARALVNDPDILLADEPTGALDSATSVQVMDILKEVAKEKLVIMVTHNNELAESYSSRIIRLHDGRVIGDTNPYDGKETEPAELPQKKHKKPSMSFFTALSLSLNNLMTKKTRTFLTSFAGSIGIIGIALILSLSNGITNFIGDVQRETLSSYPITIAKESTDLSKLITTVMDTNSDNSKVEHDDGRIYSNAVMYDVMNSVSNVDVKTNNLSKFKSELTDNYQNNELADYVSSVQYEYDTDMNVYVQSNGEFVNADINKLFKELYSGAGVEYSEDGIASSFFNFSVWDEMLAGAKDENGEYTALVSDLVKDQYDVIYGQWPTAKDEVVLVVTENNEISDITLFALGLISTEDMQSMILKAMTTKAEDYKSEVKSWTYEELCNTSFRLVLDVDYYKYNEATNTYTDIRNDDSQLKSVIGNGLPLKICGIIRPNPDATSTMLNGTLGYTAALTDYIIEATSNADIVKRQMSADNANRDVITGVPFEVADNADSATMQILRNYLHSLSSERKQEIYLDSECKSDGTQAKAIIDQMLANADSREKLVSMIAESMEMSEDDLKGFLSNYTDEQIRDMIIESASEKLSQQEEEANRAKVIAEASVPDEETLTTVRAYIEQQYLANGATKQQILIGQYMAYTGMSAADVSKYVMGLGEDEINTRFSTIVEKDVSEYTARNYTATEEQIAERIAAMFDTLIDGADDAKLISLYNDFASVASLQNTLKALGYVDKEVPSAINIYASTFEAKDGIADVIGKYNEKAAEEDKIEYTDYVALIMSSITTIINIISYVLIAFVSISLVVSSIMIGIITYISVLERTKEIGILRSIGASKRDVSRVFNAETMIVGFASGVIGIVLTVILCIPISLIVQSLSGIHTIRATLPWLGGVILLAISIILTLVAGLIPSKLAAKKDPVVALRSE